jgi:xanthine dehydrogenase small subunit
MLDSPVEPVVRLRFILNADLVDTDAAPGTPVLDWLRVTRGLRGTKEGCREGDCGACLVLVGRSDGAAVRYRALTSCLLPMAEVDGCHLVTVEGLGGDALSAVQRLLVEEGAIQCGFCTPGIAVAMTGFLLTSDHPDLDSAIAAVEGNICRCTGHASIRRAGARLVELARTVPAAGARATALAAEGLLPEWFAGIPDRLAPLAPARAAVDPAPGQLVVAGGTDAYVQRPDELAAADLALLSRAALGGVWSDDQHLYLGATTTAEELFTSPELLEVVPALRRAHHLVSSQPIRHRATVGGNIVNASPIGDLTVILLGLGAEVGVGRASATRTLPLAALFEAYKRLALEPGELVRWVRFPLERRHARFNFEKVSKRATLDIASVNSAISLRLERGVIADAHLSAGGVAPIPLALVAAEAFLEGREVSAATAREAAAVAAAEISPISDVRGSADYKTRLLRRLVLAHFQVLFGLDEGLR